MKNRFRKTNPTTWQEDGMTEKAVFTLEFIYLFVYILTYFQQYTGQIVKIQMKWQKVKYDKKKL